MAKLNIDLSEDDETPKAEQAELRSLAAPLPSVAKSKAAALKEAERVQFAFSNVPKPIKESFVAAAKRKGLTQKEFLYHCLRAGGLDIPELEKIDGRRR